METWKEINKDYSVSSFGRVKSLKHKKEKILNPILCGGNIRYPTVILCSNNNRISKRVHALVADAFLPPIENTEIDHIDRNPNNNHIDNLRRVPKHVNLENRIFKNPLGHHIQKNNNKYLVRVLRQGVYIVCEPFNTLEEAITYRDLLPLN